jgi:ribosomal protein L4
MMIAVNPKMIGLAFAGLFACALALQLALTILVAVVGFRPWDKTYTEHAREMLNDCAVEETVRNIVISDRREMPLKRTGRELEERVVTLWVRCVRNDVIDWLNSDDRVLSMHVDRRQASWQLHRFVSVCNAQLGIQPPWRPSSSFNCGTPF